MNTSILIPALLCLGVVAGAHEPASQPFRDGERVVFFGDSITQGGRYIQELQAFYATRFPERRIAYENAGIGGSAIGGSLSRIQDDVLGRKPTRVLMLFGFNDVGMTNYKVEPPDAEVAKRRAGSLGWYSMSLKSALKTFKDSGVPIEVLSPPPYDQYSTTLPSGQGLVSVNEGLATLTATGKAIVAEAGAPFIDLNTPLTRILAAGPGFTWAQDRIHPGPAGNLLIARVILAAQGLSGPVATVEVDFAARTAGATTGCTVDKVAADGAGLSFSYRAAALPFPVVQPEYRDADRVLAWSDLNQEIIRVRGLPAGDWTLEIGGSAVGRFPAAALATGVDIAGLDTPQQLKARKIRELIAKKSATEGPLRTIAQVRQWLIDSKADLNDPASVETALVAVVAKAGQYKGYYEQCVATYRKTLDRMPQLRQESEQILAAIHALQATETLAVRVIPAAAGATK